MSKQAAKKNVEAPAVEAPAVEAPAKVKKGKKGKRGSKLLCKYNGKPPVHNRAFGVADKLFHGSELTTCKPVAKFKGKPTGETSLRQAMNGQIRLNWQGHSLASLLRYMGKAGASSTAAGEWMAALGYPGIHATTLVAQTSAGRCGKRGVVAELTREQIKYLESIRPAEQEDAEADDAE